MDNICNRNHQYIALLTEDRYRVLRHIIVLISIFTLAFFSGEKKEYASPYDYYGALMGTSIFIAIFYINMYLLVPHLFFKTKYVLYIIVILLLTGLALVGMDALQRYLFAAYRIAKDDRPISALISKTVQLSLITLVSTSLKLFQRWIKDNQRIYELNNLTLSMELTGLKNQINPHFLFNMLNNVNVLIKTNPEKASTVVLKLSEFLRYQLYENDEEETSLMSETEFLSNFLNLENIRRDNFSFRIDTDIQNSFNIFIPPNLFTVFVENAIKHSVDIEGGETYVLISLRAANKQLHFTCVNSTPAETDHFASQSGGLGLVNIKRRLNLLYKDTYQLTMTDTKKEYIVNLTIPL